jgi:hypothetical protein
MIKYALTAAAATLILGAPLAHAQMAQPVQLAPPGNSINANVTITSQPQPGLNDYQGYNQDYGQGYAAPMPGPYMPPVSPRTTWIPGHYNWDPNTSNYVFAAGQYVEAPRENAQWLPGHWAQTPTSWIWVNGAWN